MSLLFSPYSVRELTLRNRTVVAPMCQYSAQHGFANDWHFVHLGRFAMGGFGLIILEATGVTAEGRISYGDLGLWSDEHIAPLKRITDFLRSQGAASGIQLAHAGRKASTPIAWRRGFDETEADKEKFAFEAWTPVGPSAEIHGDPKTFTEPHALSVDEIKGIVEAFAAAARRADAAGFDLVEIHGAHGYLLNQFLSPLANKRTDEYGGSRENRMRLPIEVAEAVRAAWPAGKPLVMRISVSDNAEGGWQVEDSLALAQELKRVGVDMIHTSSGGFEQGRIKPAPGYQVPFARAVHEIGIPTIAVGLLENAKLAEETLRSGDADLIAVARGALDDPNWPIHAHHELDAGSDAYDLWPVQARERVRSKDRVLGIRGNAA